jgi:2,3-dihydroxybenzoate-AMP ligase
VQLAADVAAGQPALRYLLTLGAGPTPPGAVAFSSLEARGPADPVAARDGVERIQRSIPADALAALQLSGGTTSTPKLIPRRHAEYWYNSRAYAEAIGLDAGSRVAHLLPVVHHAAIVCGLHAAHSAGAAFAVAQHDEQQLLALARQGAVTHMMISPPMAKAVLASAELKSALGGLRVLTWVLGAMPAELTEAFETGSCRVTQMFGMAEGLCMFTPVAAPAQLRLSTVGTPVSGHDEVRVYAPGTERLVEPGQPGELCCRGPYTIRGYYRAPERNREAFTSDGFYRTGDIVRAVEGSGGPYYALEDRIKDLINRAGEKVNALEIESLLLEHEAIAEVALVAMPDDRMGERACVFVVAAAGSSAPSVGDIQSFLDGLGVAKFKWPERIEPRSELPRTNIQKVDKKALRLEIAAMLEAERG